MKKGSVRVGEREREREKGRESQTRMPLDVVLFRERRERREGGREGERKSMCHPPERQFINNSASSGLWGQRSGPSRHIGLPYIYNIHARSAAIHVKKYITTSQYRRLYIFIKTVHYIVVFKDRKSVV